MIFTLSVSHHDFQTRFLCQKVPKAFFHTHDRHSVEAVSYFVSKKRKMHQRSLGAEVIAFFQNKFLAKDKCLKNPNFKKQKKSD
jgi:hypothetical protein